MRAVLDLERYPIDRPGSEPYAALVARCREDLAADGMFSLDEFMWPDVAQGVADQVADDMRLASFHHSRTHNVYFRAEVEGLAPDHPALQEFRTSNHTLCADQLAGTAVTDVYEFAPLRAFVADVMGKAELHVMADPLARLNVMAYGADDALNWHFDRSEFTITLLLQAPEAGGEFEYRTGLRSADEPNYEGVARLLAGLDPEVQRMSLRPGTLNIFKGVNTPHRVIPVKGTRQRVIAVLSYFEQPGVMFSESERRGFYGRA